VFFVQDTGKCVARGPDPLVSLFFFLAVCGWISCTLSFFLRRTTRQFRHTFFSFPLLGHRSQERTSPGDRSVTSSWGQPDFPFLLWNIFAISNGVSPLLWRSGPPGFVCGCSLSSSFSILLQNSTMRQGGPPLPLGPAGLNPF